MTSVTAARHDQFMNLRRRLTDLGYTETFGIEYVTFSLFFFIFNCPFTIISYYA